MQITLDYRNRRWEDLADMVSTCIVAPCRVADSRARAPSLATKGTTTKGAYDNWKTRIQGVENAVFRKLDGVE